MNYFLVSVSNRTNLDLCLKYALAGFTSSISGVWAFCDIAEGDFISFLYGARVYNLYEVVERRALRNASRIGPWPPVTFSMSGRTYYFPFRLSLRPVRYLEEPLVRLEFAYVAENLLLRGGYRKTHFQADQTTLHSVSQMGQLAEPHHLSFALPQHQAVTPRFAFAKGKASPPEVFPFSEVILQGVVRKHLSGTGNLGAFLKACGLHALEAQRLEVLGEKALPEGHVDILVKEATPFGIARKIVVEVKTGRATPKDIAQLLSYRNEIKNECEGAALICKVVSREMVRKATAEDVAVFTFSIRDLDESKCYTFDELLTSLELTKETRI